MKLLRLTPALKATSAPYNQFSLGLKDTIDQTIFSFNSYEDIQIDKDIEVVHGSGSILSSYLALKGLVKNNKFDVIHIHNGLTGVLFFFAISPFNLSLLRKCIFTLHNSWYVLKTRNQFLDFFVMIFSASVCTCGQSSFNSIPWVIKFLIGKKMKPVVNGFDNKRIDNISSNRSKDKYYREESSLKVLCVGTLNNTKNQIALLRAIKEIDKEMEIIFLGDGRNMQMLEEYSRSIPYHEMVSFKGLVSRDTTIEHMLEADVCISLSKGEGLPIAVLESMYAGCFLILSNISPHLEVSPPKDRCIFVEPSNQDQIIKSINYALSNLNAIRSGRGISKEYSIDNFSAERMLEEYKVIYNSLYDHHKEI